MLFNVRKLNSQCKRLNSVTGGALEPKIFVYNIDPIETRDLWFSRYNHGRSTIERP